MRRQPVPVPVWSCWTGTARFSIHMIPIHERTWRCSRHSKSSGGLRKSRSIIRRTGTRFTSPQGSHAKIGRRPTGFGGVRTRKKIPCVLTGGAARAVVARGRYSWGRHGRQPPPGAKADPAFRVQRAIFRCVFAAATPKRKKPHPAPLRLALRRLRAKPGESVYVGDAPEDIEMARRAGVHAIGVLGPFPTAERIRAEKPDVLLTSIRELPGYYGRSRGCEPAAESAGRRADAGGPA